MPRGPHPYKGIPRSQWPKGAIQKKAVPDAVSAQSFKPVESNVDLNVPIPSLAQDRFEAPPSKATAIFTPKAPPPNLFSGKIRKLVLIGKDGNMDDPVPGYRTHWFVDVANSGVRINQARASGWEFIGNDEVALMEGLTASNNDLGSHVRQIAGAENGVPYYQYAMKKPLWMEEAHKEEYEKTSIQPIKDVLKKGTISKNPADRQYSAGNAPTLSSLPPNEIGTVKTLRQG